MDFLHQIKLSFKFYWRAFRFIDNNNLWKLMVIPGIVNLVTAILIVIFAIKTSGIIIDSFLQNFETANSDQAIHSFIEGLLFLVIRASVFFLYLKVYRYISLISLAPLFAFISSKVQAIDADGIAAPCTSKYLLNCTRGIRIAVRNFVLEVFLTILVLVLFFLITWILPLAPIAILVIESYFMGYAMADYRNECFNLSIRESRKVINTYLGLILGNGLFFNFILLIPLLGVLFAPVLALVASGLSLNYVEKRKSIQCNSDQSTLMMAKS